MQLKVSRLTILCTSIKSRPFHRFPRPIELRRCRIDPTTGINVKSTVSRYIAHWRVWIICHRWRTCQRLTCMWRNGRWKFIFWILPKTWIEWYLCCCLLSVFTVKELCIQHAYMWRQSGLYASFRIIGQERLVTKDYFRVLHVKYLFSGSVYITFTSWIVTTTERNIPSVKVSEYIFENCTNL